MVDLWMRGFERQPPATQQLHRRTPALELQGFVKLKSGCAARIAYEVT